MNNKTSVHLNFTIDFKIINKKDFYLIYSTSQPTRTTILTLDMW